MDAWLQVVQAFGAAVIGGVIGPFVVQARDRRSARALVREKIVEVEALRWEDESYQEFRRSLASLEAAAIVARVSRRMTMEYIGAAEAARGASETFPEGPDGGPICVLMDMAVAARVTAALEALSSAIWHPWVHRLRHRHMRRVQAS